MNRLSDKAVLELAADALSKDHELLLVVFEPKPDNDYTILSYSTMPLEGAIRLLKKFLDEGRYDLCRGQFNES